MAPISSILPSTIDSRREEIQMTQQKADDAISELRNAGDSEVADILLARSEELKKRSDKLLNDYPKATSTTPASSGDKADAKDSEIKLDHLEDGSLKFTMPPDETEGKPKVYILSSPNFDRENPVQNIIMIAEEMANTTINYLDKLPNLELSKMEYLTDICESLTSQKKKINLQKAEGSLTALEVAAQLYLNDAFKFYQSVLIITANSDQDRIDETAET